MAPQSSNRVAVIDVGSNTLLMLVVERQGGALIRVSDRCRFGRLGQGIDRTGEIDRAALARSLAILRDYRQEARTLGAWRLAAIGTQALREAANREEFLTPAEEILGTPVEVISGEREAELAFVAAVTGAAEPCDDGEVVVADVGGASTEIITGRRNGHMRNHNSLPLGCVRHTERHLPSNPPSHSEVDALIADIDSILSGATRALPRGVPLIASGGTASTMAAVALGLSEYDPDRVHGTRLEPAAVSQQLEDLLSRTTAERRRVPGMEPERADVIAAGVQIYARLLHHLKAPALTISDRGIRWGLARELLLGR